MDKLKDVVSFLPVVLLLAGPVILGVAFPKVVLISLGMLLFLGVFKKTGSGIGAAAGDALMGLLGLLGAAGGVVGLLFSFFGQ